MLDYINKICELYDITEQNPEKLNCWEIDFILSFKDGNILNVDNITKKQEEKIDELYNKYIGEE